jgi:hypothetical protein
MADEEKSPLENFKPDLSHLIQIFGTQALISCGKIMNPVSRKFETDLALAQYHIAILEVLEAKTAGNATEDEKQLLKDMLHHAHMAYIDAGRGTGKVSTE